ncbi:hypothetical protein D3C87_2197080 [compost metagenome]
MDNWVHRFKTAETAPGYDSVIIPGEPETAAENERITAGIPLISLVVEDLRCLATKMEVTFPKSI